MGEWILPLGDRMKEYEKQCDYTIVSDCWFVVRLDMRAGHTFTRGLNKPFDDRYIQSMIETTEYLVREFHSFTAYTQSDEITLLFGPQDELIFRGRIQKINSIFASTASAMFLKSFLQKKPDCDRIPTFDSRIIILPSREEAFNNLMWRCRDCVKNSIASLAQAHFSHRKLHGLHGTEMKQLLVKEKNINWDEMDPVKKYGVIVKKYTIPHRAYNPKTKMEVETQRSVYSHSSVNLCTFRTENMEWICSKLDYRAKSDSMV